MAPTTKTVHREPLDTRRLLIAIKTAAIESASDGAAGTVERGCRKQLIKIAAVNRTLLALHKTDARSGADAPQRLMH